MLDWSPALLLDGMPGLRLFFENARLYPIHWRSAFRARSIIMSADELNRKLAETIGFTEKDLEANRQGRLSDRQHQKLLADEARNRRQLKWAIGLSLVIGVAVAVYSLTLALFAFAIAVAAFGIMQVSAHLSGTYSGASECKAVSGPIELHYSSRGTSTDSAVGLSYRIWAGMKYGENERGQAVSAPEKVLTVPKEVWKSFDEDTEYTVYHYRGKLLSAERQKAY